MFGGEDTDIIPDMEQFRVDKLLHPSPSVGLGPGVDDVRGQEDFLYSASSLGNLLYLASSLTDLLYSPFSLGDLS